MDGPAGAPVNFAFNAIARSACVERPDAKTFVTGLARLLVQARGITLEQNDVQRQDNSLQAWPWIDQTFSWVEPTAWCMLLLKKCRALGIEGAADRITVAEKLIRDRVCHDGGWNYGGSNVYGQELYAYVPTTAIGLLAMQDRRDDPVVVKSLEFLKANAHTEPTTEALGLTMICFSIYGVPTEAIRKQMQPRDRDLTDPGTRAGPRDGLVCCGGRDTCDGCISRLTAERLTADGLRLTADAALRTSHSALRTSHPALRTSHGSGLSRRHFLAALSLPFIASACGKSPFIGPGACTPVAVGDRALSCGGLLGRFRRRDRARAARAGRQRARQARAAQAEHGRVRAGDGDQHAPAGRRGRRGRVPPRRRRRRCRRRRSGPSARHRVFDHLERPLGSAQGAQAAFRRSQSRRRARRAAEEHVHRDDVARAAGRSWRRRTSSSRCRSSRRITGRA